MTGIFDERGNCITSDILWEINNEVPTLQHPLLCVILPVFCGHLHLHIAYVSKVLRPIFSDRFSTAVAFIAWADAVNWICFMALPPAISLLILRLLAISGGEGEEGCNCRYGSDNGRYVSFVGNKSMYSSFYDLGWAFLNHSCTPCALINSETTNLGAVVTYYNWYMFIDSIIAILMGLFIFMSIWYTVLHVYIQSFIINVIPSKSNLHMTCLICPSPKQKDSGIVPTGIYRFVNVDVCGYWREEVFRCVQHLQFSVWSTDRDCPYRHSIQAAALVIPWEENREAGGDLKKKNACLLCNTTLFIIDVKWSIIHNYIL